MKNRLTGMAPYAALLSAAAYLYRDAGHFAYAARPGEIGPDFWPRAILWLLMVVCGYELVRRALRTGPAKTVAPEPGAAAQGERGTRYPHLLALGIGLTVAYVALLPVLGFFLATAAYLGAFMVAGRYRRAGVIAAASLLGSLAFVFVFMRIVYVSLPLGVGPFKQLSVWIMAGLGIH